MDHARPRRKGIAMGNILGDPFALATLSIAIVSALKEETVLGFWQFLIQNSLLGLSPLSL